VARARQLQLSRDVPTEAPVKKPRFIGKTIPLLLISSLLGLLGVLVVDRFIEKRQVTASTHVAATAIATTRELGRFAGALEQHRTGVVSATPTEAQGAALVLAREKLARAIQEFDPFVEDEDRPAWRQATARALALERVTGDDLVALEAIVDDCGLGSLAKAERQHTLHGMLEAITLFLMCAIALSLLLTWRKQEARARDEDAAVEDRLRHSVGELDAFAGRLAHDVRTPLQPILSDSQAIERAPVPDTVRRQAERIERAARRLGRMVDSVLQFTRASAVGEGERAQTQVNAAIEGVMPELEDMARSRAAHLAVDLGPDAPLACAAEVVQSLVSNLVDNALKYGAKEGSPATVTVRTRLEVSHCVVEVEDEGPGIPEQLRERVFEPLFRGHHGGEGAGLGLSIVDRVVTTLGGHVELCEGRAGGALFRILLPREPTRDASPASSGESGRRVSHV
jgi:signal transduction histidine kinase